MFKKVSVIMCFLLVAIMLPSVSGTNVTVGVKTDNETANIYTHTNTGTGRTNYFINNQHLGKKMHSVGEDINDDQDILQAVWEVFKENELQKGIVDRPEEDLEHYELKFKRIMESIFVTWEDLKNIYSRHEHRLNQQRLEIEALKKLHSEEELCKAKMTVANEHDISEVKCGDTKFVAQGDSFVGFQQKE